MFGMTFGIIFALITYRKCTNYIENMGRKQNGKVLGQEKFAKCTETVEVVIKINPHLTYKEGMNMEVLCKDGKHREFKLKPIIEGMYSKCHWKCLSCNRSWKSMWELLEETRYAIEPVIA